MAVIALVSPGNSPGVTTTAFALTLAWPQPVLLAECSPAGGHLLAGYFQGRLSALDRGLWQLALATRHGQQAALADLGNQIVALDETGDRRLLPGLRDPFWPIDEAMWEQIGDLFAALPGDVIADIGAVHVDLPFPLVRRADLLLMVMRPTFEQIAAAKPRLTKLREALADTLPIGLCLVGDGEYDPRDIASERAGLGPFATVIRLPADRKSAAVLVHGSKPGRGFTTAPLLREAALAAKGMQRSIIASVQVPQHGAQRGPGRLDKPPRQSPTQNMIAGGAR
ncbi:hypothetical protein [Actinomadura sp. 6N118]|uniref:hypothetical protein n=1 Tax=Actinomadura sp. 6N118 TaxID=3375151 RepID=UPI00379C270E